MDLPPEVATTAQSVASPSGQYVLEVLEAAQNNTTSQYFRILNADGTLVFTSDQYFDPRHTTYFLWGPEDRVWVYSGDTGTYFWAYNSTSDTWARSTYARSDVPAPDFLKSQRPSQHPR